MDWKPRMIIVLFLLFSVSGSAFALPDFEYRDSVLRTANGERAIEEIIKGHPAIVIGDRAYENFLKALLNVKGLNKEELLRANPKVPYTFYVEIPEKLPEGASVIAVPKENYLYIEIVPPGSKAVLPTSLGDAIFRVGPISVKSRVRGAVHRFEYWGSLHFPKDSSERKSYSAIGLETSYRIDVAESTGYYSCKQVGMEREVKNMRLVPLHDRSREFIVYDYTPKTLRSATQIIGGLGFTLSGTGPSFGLSLSISRQVPPIDVDSHYIWGNEGISGIYWSFKVKDKNKNPYEPVMAAIWVDPRSFGDPNYYPIPSKFPFRGYLYDYSYKIKWYCYDYGDSRPPISFKRLQIPLWWIFSDLYDVYSSSGYGYYHFWDGKVEED